MPRVRRRRNDDRLTHVEGKAMAKCEAHGLRLVVAGTGPLRLWTVYERRSGREVGRYKPNSGRCRFASARLTDGPPPVPVPPPGAVGKVPVPVNPHWHVEPDWVRAIDAMLADFREHREMLV